MNRIVYWPIEQIIDCLTPLTPLEYKITVSPNPIENAGSYIKKIVTYQCSGYIINSHLLPFVVEILRHVIFVISQ